MSNVKQIIAKQFPLLRIPRRMLRASSYYNKHYLQILKWGFSSHEGGNYTYELTQGNLLYLAHIVAVAASVSIAEVQRYMVEADNDAALREHIICGIESSSLRTYADLRVCFGRRLGWYAFVRIMKPKVVVETGVDKGMGAVLLCSALLRNRQEGASGRYYGTDINPEAGYLLSGVYKEMGEILYGDSISSLKNFSPKIDLFINDSDHSDDYEYREYQTIKDKLSPESVILGDNAHDTDKLAVFAKETGRSFLFFKEEPYQHWYPGAGIGIAFWPRRGSAGGRRT